MYILSDCFVSHLTARACHCLPTNPSLYHLTRYVSLTQTGRKVAANRLALGSDKTLQGARQRVPNTLSPGSAAKIT